MTDTLTAADITPDIVNATITALGTTLQRATARLGEEEAEFTEKRDRMVQVAHRRGNDNGIGRALDDLLEEFDLPRRPVRATFRALLMLSSPLQRSGDTLMTEHSTYVYRGPGVRVSWPVAMDSTVSMREGDTCLCDNAEQNIRDWLIAYYGATPANAMTYQFTHLNCGHEDCPSTAHRWDTSESPNVPWHTLPVYAVQEQPAPDRPRARAMNLPLAV